MPGHSLHIQAETQQAHEEVKGSPKDAVKEKLPSSSVKGASPSSSKKKKKKCHKMKKSHSDSQLSSQKDSQGDLLKDSQGDSQKNAQVSLCQSIHQVWKESTTTSFQKKHSGDATKHSNEKCLSKTPSRKDQGKDIKKKHRTHKQK